ncbi:nucleoside deaminase [uncultured Chitinophaga sp.]|uniref:nucleoside deaminase n=1 Tax=uncultured Chitinophaga sp. TaxID=339340 RepID=UPI0025D3D6FD|nr:nucleoside deaminase [uncultured Chitinophaga sp.]
MEANDEHYMQQALKEARKAGEDGEVPIGAVVVMNGQIIGRGHNQVERLTDCTAHAEMIALTSAFSTLGSKYLMDATLYVTLEPCVMCSGALYWSKIGRIVYGAQDEKNGYRRVTGEQSPFHPKTKIEHGVCADESLKLVKDFFASKR